MNEKVVVLLSAYNGEKYIKEQIESILAQSYKNVELFIRDDGSKDDTVKILKTYEHNPRIWVSYGENIGFFASFLWLLNNSGQADYYAFADQDDFWYTEKIETSVKWLRAYSNVPALYCCNADICNANMQLIHKGKPTKYSFSIPRTIVNGETGWGYTQVMNQKARQLLLGKKAPKYIKVYGHDTWAHLVCLCCGKVLYDKSIHVNMRRHGNNTSVQEYQGGSFWRHQLWRIKEFIIYNKGKAVYIEGNLFLKEFWNEIPDEARKTIVLYLEPGHRLKKVLYKKRYRDSILDEMILRILFLFGKM